jgi:ATP-binding cassette, subfamily B, multidrug efflux pump
MTAILLTLQEKSINNMGKTHPTQTARRDISHLTTLYGYLRQCSGTYLLGALLLLGTNALALFIPWLLKLAVDSLQHPAAGERGPGWFAGLIVVAALGQGIARIFSRTTLLHAARRIEYLIREELYNKLLALDLPFFSRERTGDLLSRFSNDLTNVRMLAGFGILNIVNTMVVYVATLALMVRINPLLTACAVVPFPLMIFVVKRISASMFRRSLRAQEELARITNQVEENVAAAAVVKAYCREEAQIGTFRTASRRYFDSNLAMARLRGMMIPVMAASGATGTLIVLFIGGRKVIEGAITLGDFVAFSGYLAMLVWPTIMMGWILNLLQRGAASMERLGHVLDARAEVTEPAEPAQPAAIRGEIEFRDLCFSYGGSPLIDGISLKIPAGTRVGFVGPVGCGKSTLMKLIPRLFPAADGQIFIDGTDVNRFSLESLRNAIGFVPQESFLFSRTLGANIGYGREGATEEQIVAAARLARLDGDVARFPEGFGTLVGERGLTLSGGQKQRAAIARALIKEPAILILDDPLSSVDARTEEEILTGLAAYYGRRTVLIVSHRLSALRDCSLIVMLDAGKIVEQGTHDELLGLNGRYAALHREQQLRAEIERA